ncbi:uncharacterized protein LOC127282136 [Leptopilina boulardi]|uniref:uncharacterized protein LOC127282136 n=1 Tax=Leptopilina boulardi TaxID=63433 RepID=UPI0021F6021A|nr:uncharacterized protein LOC127282136 [Leptopilina boulardi]
MVLLNGRSNSDSPANWTFVGHQGRSVTDLIWASLDDLEIVEDLKVLPLATLSDHLPVAVYLKDSKTEVCDYGSEKTTSWKLKFDKLKSEEFTGIMRWRDEVANVEGDIDKLNDNLIGTVTDVADRLGMRIKCEQRSVFISRNKPWFDKECRDAKCSMVMAFKDLWENDSEAEKLASAKNASFFWTIVNSKRRKGNSNKDNITLEKWQSHLNVMFPQVNEEWPILPQITHPILDKYIEIKEILSSFSKFKEKKSPGVDLVNFSFLKRLPENWMLFLEYFYNKILDSEKVPKAWGSLVISMLHKKGNLSEPENFRPITLVNNIAKGFTQVLSERLIEWMDENSVVPEFQSGFRRGRGVATSSKAAENATLSVITNIKADTWSTYNKLFESLVKSIPFYAIEVWGQKCTNSLEKIQLSFFKKLLWIPLNTPSYAVRLETGRLRLACAVLSRTMSWINKINKMDNTRLPRLCLERLMELARRGGSGSELNWYSQIKHFFEYSGMKELWDLSDIENLVRNSNDLIAKFTEKCLLQDLEDRS